MINSTLVHKEIAANSQKIIHYCKQTCLQAESLKNKVVLVKEVLSKLSKQQYSIEELTRKPLPEGVDPLRLEDYLSEQDFKVLTPLEELI